MNSNSHTKKSSSTNPETFIFQIRIVLILQQKPRKLLINKKNTKKLVKLHLPLLVTSGEEDEADSDGGRFCGIEEEKLNYMHVKF